jgi:hypothetical protein
VSCEWTPRPAREPAAAHFTGGCITEDFEVSTDQTSERPPLTVRDIAEEIAGTFVAETVAEDVQHQAATSCVTLTMLDGRQIRITVEEIQR